MRSRRILALMLAASMMISQVQPVYATAATPYKTEDGEAGIDTNIAQTDVENDTNTVQAGVKNNTDGEENSTLTEDVDETDETEAEKQKTTEVEAAEKTDKESDTEQKMKTIYEVVEAEPDLVAIDGFSEFALLSETDTEWNGSFGEQLSDPVAIELYQTLKEKLMDDGYYREEPFAPLIVEIPLKNRLMYTSAT